MALTVTKVSQAQYVATATPPHVREAWSTTAPLRMNQLWDALIAREAHQTDAGDAMDDADREWEEEKTIPGSSSGS